MAASHDGRSSRSERDKRMAAHLKRRGILHGVRMTRTLAPPVPKLDDVGSAAYRRLKKKA